MKKRYIRLMAVLIALCSAASCGDASDNAYDSTADKQTENLTQTDSDTVITDARAEDTTGDDTEKEESTTADTEKEEISPDETEDEDATPADTTVVDSTTEETTQAETDEADDQTPVVIPAAPVEPYHDELEITEVWSNKNGERTANGDKYIQYRLPGLTVSRAGTVILYGEARTENNNDGFGSGGDLAEFDLFIRRSEDGGKTFGEPIYIARGSDYLDAGFGETIDNPVMMCDENGKLHLLYSCNVARFSSQKIAGGLFYTYSEDDGLTWSPTRNIANSLGRFTAFSDLACGPGHGICTSSGRLIVTAWTNMSAAKDRYAVRTVYSDDLGKTWQLGDVAAGNCDESTIVELSDGSLMILSRQFSTPNPMSPYRHITVSETGIDSWSKTYADKALPDPACAASSCSVNLEGYPYAILFVNCDSATERRNVTVKCSYDDGKTWSRELLIDKSAGGYCEIAVDQNGKVYVAYEKAVGSQVNLATFSFYDYFGDGPMTQPQFDDLDGVSVLEKTYTPSKENKSKFLAQVTGNGTAELPYVLDSADDLALMAVLTNSPDTKSEFAGAHYRLVTDIDLAEKAWSGIGDDSGAGFYGVFDGGEHTISNLSLDKGFAKIGFFKSAGNGAVIKNLTIEGGTNEITSHRSGVLIGISVGDLMVENCHTNVDFIMTAQGAGACAGGILGRDMGVGEKIIANCTNSGNITVDLSNLNGAVGGIVGLANPAEANASMHIYDCTNSGSISVKSDRNDVSKQPNDYGVGSIVGATGWSRSNAFKLSNCYASGTVTAHNANKADINAGIVIGYANRSLERSGVIYDAVLTVDGKESRDLAVFGAAKFGYTKKSK